MTDTGQPNGAAAADLLARHNKKKQKKASNPEEPFDFIFSKNLALRPITDKKTRDLDHRGLMELVKVMDDLDKNKFRITDAPYTCATCAVRFTQDIDARPCI